MHGVQVADIGHWIQGQEAQSDRIDSARWYLIVGERQSRKGIFYGDAGRREIAVAHRLRGNLILNRLPSWKPEAFVRAEEESLILAVVYFRNQYRAPDRGSEIIADQPWLCLLAKGGGIQGRVLVIPEQ